MFHYLFQTQDYCICFRIETKNISSFVYASDPSFANNLLNQKSSQGYIIKVFGGAVAQKANKQDIVITSSTKAKLLTVLQTAKETIYLSWLIKSLTLILHKALTIECDNQQTIYLLVKKIIKLQTKLRHVNIHFHWLRQEVQRRTIHTCRIPTKEMIADGLTKVLMSGNYKVFVEMSSLKDQRERLASIKLEEDQRNVLLLCEAEQNSEVFGYGADAS